MQFDWKKNIQTILAALNTVILVVLVILVVYNNNQNPATPQPVRTAQQPAPNQKVDIDINTLAANSPSQGQPGAKNSIVIFNSFTCGYCAKAREVLIQIHDKYPEKTRIIYKNFIRNDKDKYAAMAAECANDQGKYFPMYSMIFTTGVTADNNYTKYASAIGLDLKSFNQCFTSNKYQNKIDQESQLGRGIGITGTPSFIINGNLSVGYRPFEVFEKMLSL